MELSPAAFKAQQFLGTLDPRERAAVSVRPRFYSIPWIRRAGDVDATDCLPPESAPTTTTEKLPDDACTAAYYLVTMKIFSRAAAGLSQFVSSAKDGQARGEPLDPGEVSTSHDRLCFWLDSASKHTAALGDPQMREAVDTLGRLKVEFCGLHQLPSTPTP